MSLHQECSYAYRCPWGSETVPGTCGFTSCKRKQHFRNAANGDLSSAHILMEKGEMPRFDYVPQIINYAKRHI